MFSLPFNNIDALSSKPQATAKTGDGPVIQKGTFKLSKAEDTYLDMSNWGKGVVWLNGHNLGKYWFIGPQQTIYVPKEWLKAGTNEISVLELLKPEKNELEARTTPILDQVRK